MVQHAAMTKGARIVSHHVGGRGGSRSFPVLKHFERDFVNVLYDADADCIGQMREVSSAMDSESHVLPYCLGEQACPAVFHLNYEPCTNSVLETNQDYGSYYFFDWSAIDFVWGEGARTMERRKVDVITLDELYRAEKVAAPAPDFLSLDTQGSEYEILRGAERLLATDILGLIVEVEFAPIYKDQKLFGDVSAYLAGRGFHFVQFMGFGEMSPFRAPVGQRGRGFQLVSEGLFLRKVEALPGDPATRRRQLLKLAFIAIVFDQFEYGLQCLEQAGDAAAGNAATCYEQFLQELRETIVRMPQHRLPSITEHLSFEESQARFRPGREKAVEPAAPPPPSPAKELLRRVPPLFFLLKKMNQGLRKAGTLLRSGTNTNQAAPADTDVERLLKRYGLDQQAETLRSVRLKQTAALRIAA
jgi:FkbM family methyltransferase